MAGDDDFEVMVSVDVDTVLWVRGELDIATAPTLRRLLAAAHPRRDLGRDDVSLVVDLSGVTFIDASGLGVLVDSARWLGRDGRTLVLRDPSPWTRRLLDITRVRDLFAIEVGPAMAAVGALGANGMNAL
jgi:anti-sigma B factor antagonist